MQVHVRFPSGLNVSRFGPVLPVHSRHLPDAERKPLNLPENRPGIMEHHAPPLIATIVLGIGLAFVFGTIANRLRVSPLVGYLLAGVAVGPWTPGFVADASLALQLADLGVILLMFGVGLHFSLKD